ncbi:MAG: hypothetical protein ACRDH6_07610 [Actinomycetota bacterium]
MVVGLSIAILLLAGWLQFFVKDEPGSLLGDIAESTAILGAIALGLGLLLVALTRTRR